MRSVLLVLAVTVGFGEGLSRAADPPFRPVSDDDAWDKLPRKNPPLPAWAKALIVHLPKTTGAMLDLDRIHRAENPLGPVLAAKLRWLAADALGCEYARRMSEGDLRRAGCTAAQVDEFTLDAKPLTLEDKRLHKFARKLTRAAYTVTDAEFAAVLKDLGPEKACAAVHTLAFANFHFRIIAALGLDPEPGAGVPPLPTALDADARARVESPARTDWALLKAAPQPKVPVTFRWADDDNDELPDVFAAMDKQKERKSRIPIPDKARFAGLPPPVKLQCENIVWMTVSMGYQPKMTDAWFVALRAFQSEAKLDRMFSNSIFFTVTRSNECFY